MNSFSQLSFNKNICDTLYLNLFKLSYSYIFWLQWIMIFINYISLKIFRLSIVSYVKKIINVTRNIFNANKVHCHFKHSCLLYWLLPRQNSMQLTPIFLEKLCHCYVYYMGVNLLCSGSWYLKDDSDPDLIWVSKRCLLCMYSCNYLFQLRRRVETNQNVKAGISEADLHFQSGVLFEYFRYLFIFFLTIPHLILPKSWDS